jgi:heme exporter protein A
MSLPLQLKADNISCERGGRVVFSNISFTLESGELLELHGANGSGKSSMLRLLAGLNSAVAGSISLENGRADSSLAEQAHYIGHADANKPALTVAENLGFWNSFLGSSNSNLALAAFNLDNLNNDQALLLSAGQKRRLALSRLHCAHRAVWLLDEPDVGLDSASRVMLHNQITVHLQSGGMVIAATHTDLGFKPVRVLNLDRLAT